MRLFDSSSESPIIAMGFPQHFGSHWQSSALSLSFTQIPSLLLQSPFITLTVRELADESKSDFLQLLFMTITMFVMQKFHRNWLKCKMDPKCQKNETKQVELFQCEGSTTPLLEIGSIYDCDNRFVVDEITEFGMAGRKRKVDDEGKQKDDLRQILRLNGGSRSQRGSHFGSQKSSRSITIAADVTKIHQKDFKGFTSTNEVRFASESQVEHIDGFWKWTSLCRIEIPSSVRIIGDNGFMKCTSLTEVHFSSGSCLYQIEGFRDCTSLCRIEIPSSVEIISQNAFRRCTSLTEVSFGLDGHVREIQGFFECSSLSRIEIPSSVELLTNGVFWRCTSLTELSFGLDSHVREIEGFRECSSLSRIEIPSSVEFLCYGVFGRCPSLTEVTFGLDSHLREIQGFQECSSLSRIEIPSSVEIIFPNAFCQSKSLTEVIFALDSHLREIQGFFEMCITFSN
jgi:hypothetical protein